MSDKRIVTVTTGNLCLRNGIVNRGQEGEFIRDAITWNIDLIMAELPSLENDRSSYINVQIQVRPLP